MNFRIVALAFLACAFTLVSCQKDTTSKIPFISLTAFAPDSIRSGGVDTPYIEFHLMDGDGDIGVDDNTSAIFYADSRYDTGFIKQSFPNIDGGIEDPKKGLEGNCLFLVIPSPDKRDDSVHKNNGDTLFYRLFITDRAGHHSDTITTHSLIIRP